MKTNKLSKDDNMKQTDNTMDAPVAKKPERREDVHDKTAEKAKIEKIEATAAAQKAGDQQKSAKAKNAKEEKKPVSKKSDEKTSNNVRIPESPLAANNPEGNADMDSRIKAQKEKLNKLTDNPNNQDPSIENLNKEQDIESRGGDEGLAKMPAPLKTQAKANTEGDSAVKAKAKSQPEAKGEIPKIKEDSKSPEDGEVNTAAAEKKGDGDANDKAPKASKKTTEPSASKNADETVRNENADAPQY